VRPSIRTRLLVLTTAVISLVVIAVAAVVWLRMSRSLRQRLDESLRAQAFAVASRLEEEYGLVQFDSEASEKTAIELFGDAFIQVLDGADNTMYASPPGWFERLSPPDRSPIIETDGVAFFDADSSDPQVRLRLMDMRLTISPSDDAKALRARVLVARPVGDVESTLTQLAWTLAGVAGVSILAALVGGHFVARQGVHQIVAVAKAIAQVAPDHPRLEIDLQRVPVELDPMIEKTGSLLCLIDRELERQRQLTADVAHDLRTPVAGVRTLLDVCVQRDRDAAEYVETINTARAALRQLSQLLDDVLTLARLDAGAEQPHVMRVLIKDVIRDATEIVRPAAIARGVSIECDGDCRVCIQTDPSKLMKILANLLSNAVGQSLPGGVVHVGTSADGNGCIIHVRDSGPGVPADLRNSIFDRFVRDDRARSGDDGHHGLGLPIARGLARLLGGNVELANTAGPGAVFHIRLPMQDNADVGKET